MTLTVVEPGIYTTVQDLGRPGFGHLGVSSSGAMDADSLRVANLLVGNRPSAAALEMTATGVTVRASKKVVVALVGPGWQVHRHSGPVASPAVCRMETGQTLRVGPGKGGAFRAYLAVRGGVETDPVMGSRSTDSRAEIGGLEGRQLVGGDRLPSGTRAVDGPVFRQKAGVDVPAQLRQLFERSFRSECCLRTVVGPHGACFTGSQKERFFLSEWEITTSSNRVGYRLRGPRIRQEADTLLSEGVVPGAVQVPAGGSPIMLMSDCQTMGGYPVLCTVITADLASAGRCAPGDKLRFTAVDLPEAERINAEKKAAFSRLRSSLLGTD